MENSVSLEKLKNILSRYDVGGEQRRDILAAVEWEFGHEIRGVKALASATGSVARWWSGVPMTNADVWEFALGEGWKPGLGDDAKSAVAFLTKNGHKFQEITPPNEKLSA